MYKVPVLRIKQAHVRDSKEPIKQTWKQLFFLHVAIASSFWGLRSFRQMLNKFKYRTPVLLSQEVAAYTHTVAHTQIFPSNVSFVAFWIESVFIIESDTKGNWLQRWINPAQSPKTAAKTNVPAWPCGSSYLTILLERRRMHFSPRYNRAGDAFDWAGLLARSPPLWCVLINTTLIVPWCYFQAWKWAFLSIVSLLDSFLLATARPSKQSQRCDWHWPCQTEHAIFN